MWLCVRPGAQAEGMVGFGSLVPLGYTEALHLHSQGDLVALRACQGLGPQPACLGKGLSRPPGLGFPDRPFLCSLQDVLLFDGTCNGPGARFHCDVPVTGNVYSEIKKDGKKIADCWFNTLFIGRRWGEVRVMHTWRRVCVGGGGRRKGCVLRACAVRAGHGAVEYQGMTHLVGGNRVIRSVRLVVSW
jgi:hypothetical protein